VTRGDVKDLLKRIIPKSTADVLRDCRGMPLSTALTYLRIRAWRRLGLRSDRAILRRVTPESVLFVCHGNIMRSPMAAEVFRHRMAAIDRAVGVASVGTWTTNGRRADPRAITAARDLGISLEGHRSRSITAAIVGNSDLICVMDYRNEVDVLTRFPGAAKKTILLGGITATRSLGPEIPDPYMSAPEDVAECYRRLIPAVDALVRALRLA
jgi:low molecular weight protein-tyrosine phosphatase